ncbi:single-strand DNA-binding protein [Clostridia bacterium]|nr:single-strand DNA-binding protein [Clostridia bacterium]
MTQTNYFTDNTVTLTGNVFSEPLFSHKIYGESFYTFDIEVERLSEATDVLPVTVSDRVTSVDALREGEKIKIEGQLRSYNSYIKQEQRNRLILTVFVRDIDFLADTEEEEGEDHGEEKSFFKAAEFNASSFDSGELIPNEVVLNGYICKPTVYRKTPFKREIADILLAVNRPYNNSDYIPCIAWGRNARFASNLKVGENIRIWGRMQSRQYQKKLSDGEVLNKTAYEVSVGKIECDMVSWDFVEDEVAALEK